MSFLSRPRVKQWGWVMLFGLACFGAGNYHETRAALTGEGQWWANHCGQVVKEKLQEHEQQDVTKYGR